MGLHRVSPDKHINEKEAEYCMDYLEQETESQDSWFLFLFLSLMWINLLEEKIFRSAEHPQFQLLLGEAEKAQHKFMPSTSVKCASHGYNGIMLINSSIITISYII